MSFKKIVLAVVVAYSVIQLLVLLFVVLRLHFH